MSMCKNPGWTKKTKPKTDKRWFIFACGEEMMKELAGQSTSKNLTGGKTHCTPPPTI